MPAKLEMLFFPYLIDNCFQRTVENTAGTLWNRTLVPPQQATKNWVGVGCTAKQIP